MYKDSNIQPPQHWVYTTYDFLRGVQPDGGSSQDVKDLWLAWSQLQVAWVHERECSDATGSSVIDPVVLYARADKCVSDMVHHGEVS